MSVVRAKDDRQLEDRRKLGAFYTPERLSQVLTDWAIRSATDTVLEPSFGGCGFLQTARDRLASLGCGQPRELIYGCDIDPVAFDYLSQSLGSPVDLLRFVRADFLQIDAPSGWPFEFNSVLANPPYISYQQIGTDQRRELMRRDWSIKGIGGRASLWAYFIAHAVSFLKQDGRMAWVLPGAFLQADYAKPIRSYLSEHFARSAVFVLRERMFLESGTDEETVILLADGHKQPNKSNSIEFGAVASIQELESTLNQWEIGSWNGSAEQRPAWLNLSGIARHTFESVDSSPACKSIGSVATIQIGLVTGANEFFILNPTGLAKAGLEEDDCRPILSKFHAARGLCFTQTDLLNHAIVGGRVHLVTADEESANPRVKSYLATFDRDRRDSVSTFKKRKIWSAPDDHKTPDAFFPVMHHSGPRLVLNPDRITCTNTVHRVYFDKQTLAPYSLIAISLLTSFSQLSAELVGRHYGSGVLKHEPREAEGIRLLLPDLETSAINAAFAEIDQAARSGDMDKATILADALILPAIGLDDWASTSKNFRSALQNIRICRRPQRRKVRCDSKSS